MNDGFAVTPDQVSLYFRKLGDGTRAVLIPNGMYLLDDFAPLAPERTLIAFDPRNRGKSDHSRDGDKLRGDIHLDVEDLEAVRRHLEIEKLDLIGHSYAATVVALYAMRYPEHVGRVVLIGPLSPVGGKQYAPPLSFDDGVLASVFARIGQLQKEYTPGSNPVDLCRKMWGVLREIYVVDPAKALRITWDRCDLPNERAFMHYWNANMMPSILKLQLAEAASSVETRVLTIHGRKDRSAPYGGGREWALVLPNARLISVDDAGHAPWIEAPEQVFPAIETFLTGDWPEGAERITSLDSQSASA